MRSFLAVSLDDPARSALAELLAGLERVAAGESSALRWSRAANIHLTLHFLGDVDPPREAALRVQLEAPLATPPFDITLGQLGTFPPARPPRVFWAAVDEGRDEMIAIHAELGRRLNAAGIALEGRPFTPHLTLARARDSEQRRARKVAQRLTHVQVPRVRWRVDHVTLYHSDLSGPAPRYDAVQHVSLRGSAGGRRE
jgi:RNA 2',3'-cyclic 3'-phosphodiesterase